MPAAVSVLPFAPAAMALSTPAPSASRFTLDGDPALEAHLARVCDEVCAGVERIIPRHRLEGILLGGGYGRGEGGVWRTTEGDRPYNDMEFYVLLRGSTVLNDRRHRAALGHLAHELSESAGLEVEFKIISSASLRRGQVTMFSYDLLCGHRRVAGPATLLRGCAHHENEAAIPAAEATRLLLNRCTGLLFAQERLKRIPFTTEDADFTGRNLAKAQLALGDAVLTVFGQYHWSCRERRRRLAALGGWDGNEWLADVVAEHTRGVDFKLHPRQSTRDAVALREDWRRISQLACRVWLWLESRRLEAAFRSPIGYVLHPATKYPDMSAGWNWLVTFRHLGWRECLTRRARRYPRERLLRSLPVLLWQPAMVANTRLHLHLQRELNTTATDAAGFAAAYTRLWEIFR
jgi:hypothetical protein